MLRRVVQSRGVPRIILGSQTSRTTTLQLMSTSLPASAICISGLRGFGVSRRSYLDGLHENIRDEAGDFGVRLDVLEKKMNKDAANIKQTMNVLQTEVKLESKELHYKVDKLDHKVAELSGKIEKFDSQIDGLCRLVKGFAADQQRQFSQFYMQGFFGIVAISMCLVGSAWVLPEVEARYLDIEIKRRAIMRDGLDRTT
ncbi:hypothetical protein NKR23_g125 [Pleurostoma richardsiae]|uniref:Uncharacterized protein n=1 Tax=Pleurostoma richardsiae TaxID=41990 RepID=A0AA38W0V6_9PEZI|nr:hypothetical protein NKR23_g125 [Pleurostoma richardsiae]